MLTILFLLCSSSHNLNASLVESGIVLEAEQRLQAPVIGALPSAIRTADELHRMDVTVATSPMPCARFVFDPVSSRPIHVLLNQAMQELTEKDAETLHSVAGDLMFDLVHSDDKTDLNRAFFQAVAKRRSHAFVNLRLCTTPDEHGNAVYINRIEHQFLQFYANGRLAAVTIIEDTEPLKGLLSHSMQLPPRQLAAQQASALAALLGPTSASLSGAMRGVGGGGQQGSLAEHIRRIVRRMAPTDKLAQWMLQYVFDNTNAAGSLTGSSASSDSAGAHNPLPRGLRYLQPPHAARNTPDTGVATPQSASQHFHGVTTGRAPPTVPAGSGEHVASSHPSSCWAEWQAAAGALSAGVPPRRQSTASSIASSHAQTPGMSTLGRSSSWASAAGGGCDGGDDDDDCASTGAVRDDGAVFGATPSSISPMHGRRRQFPEMTATLWHTLTPFQQVLAHTWGDSMQGSTAPQGAPPPTK